MDDKFTFVDAGGERSPSLLSPLPSVSRTLLSLFQMNYNDFLTCLMKLSVKIYPRSRSRDEAFQRLLMDNVLPLAARRCPESVEFYLENAEVRSIFHTYKDALEQIFAFYASNDKRQEGSRGASGPAGFGASHSGRSPVRATKAVNTMKEALAYPEFLKFAQAFDLSNNVILSTIELGDIYLSSIKTVAPDSSMRKLSFDEFWESLVRCALVAYSKISDVTIIDKIRGLLLYMWRAINGSVPKTWADGRRTGTTNQGDLLAGAMLFNKRFTAAWAADNYRDYLSPAHAPNEDGQTVLARLKGGTGGAQLAATASSASMSASSVGSGGLAAARGATDYGY